VLGRVGKRADEGCALARECGFAADPVVVEGSPRVWTTLVELAEQRDVGLIVVGRRGQSRVSAALFGSVSAGVLHHVQRPVLTVPTASTPGP
jgi:nucleotide-binding universal stress UspA family protein